MIADPRPLQAEFVPGDVVHRNHEVDALSAALKPLTRGEPGQTAFLHGPSGTGKTCIAQHTLSRLQEATPEVDGQYVNCWESNTRYKTLYRLLEGVDRALDVHRQSTPRDELVDRLREGIDGPYVAVLDEVDQLEDTSVLYELNRVRELELVLIANREEELFSRLDERVYSRFTTAMRVQFDRYSNEELMGILADRARWALHHDAVSDARLHEIADAAGGDARVAILGLQAAARLAEEEGAESITGEAVRRAIPEAKSEMKRENLQKLTDHQRVVYDVVSERGEVSPGELYEAYCERVEEAKTRRMVRNYLQKMQRYNLVRADGEGRGREYSIT